MNKKVLLSILLIGVMMFGIGMGTYAWFTSTATSQNNYFEAGELEITGPGANKVAENVVDVRNIYPGWEQQKTINIQNTGTIPFQFKVSATSNNNTLLYNGQHNIQVKVNGGEYVGINSFNNVSLGTIAAGGNKDVTFTFKLPTTADNNYQNLLDSFNFVFDATQIENNGTGWDTYALVKTIDSGQNATNAGLNRPHINYTVAGNQITFEFVNPTTGAYAFDYRVDGEAGTRGQWADTIIKGGELKDQEIGESYNLVNVPKGETRTVTVTAAEEVWAGLRLGPENDYYLDWIKFEVQ
ncbi:TasA family protein [Anaerosolibacter sp.]|uniref:TasA family protein n=1 Tax=Anaerosolibacter sp. TaxID=1872527 RepID=UPI00263480D7|nr:TasA family protein [Anaerosolibacter sp.]